MFELEASVVQSLDGHSRELYQYLPYLLQDFWELGDHYAEFETLLQRNHLAQRVDLRVLDLGCGKGAIGIKLAKHFGWSVLGIDGMPGFIEEARRKAAEWDVSKLCEFRVGDLRQEVEVLSGFDLVVLGAVGPVLGDFEATVEKLRPCVGPSGTIIVDDAYLQDDKRSPAGLYHSKSALLDQLERAKAELIDEVITESAAVAETCSEQTKWIRKRADELAAQHPSKADLFAGYVRAQEEESRVLEHDVTCALLLLRLR